jgi:6-phosphogluconolactonase
MIAEHAQTDMKALTDALAGDIVGWLEAAIDARGAASLVITGGATPAPLYEELATRPMRWNRVTITLSDERWVPVTDKASNEAMVRRTLLGGLPAAATFVPLHTGDTRAVDAIPAIEAAIASMPQPFDVCLLGIGEDGHFASHYPGAPMRRDVLVEAVNAPGAAGAAERLSLSFGAIVAARRIALLFTGTPKLAVFRAARDGLSETPLALLLAQADDRTSAYWCAETT